MEPPFLLFDDKGLNPQGWRLQPFGHQAKEKTYMTSKVLGVISKMREVMTHKVVGHMLLGLATLALASTSLLAADSDDHGVIVFRGDHPWAMATRPSSLITPATMTDTTKLYTIYSNLGPKNDAYNDQNSNVINGPDQGQYWEAMPFTPTSDAEVTEIETAIQFYEGEPNGVVISLYDDSNGLPDKAIHTWNLKNLPPFGTCCKLDVATDSKGLTVKKGTQYWVVASTNSSEKDTIDVWNFTYYLLEGYCAYNRGEGWTIAINQYLSAFGVFGKKVK
jgi:hypothetical protein